MKLLDWIILEKLNYDKLSLNYNAIHMLKENPDKINWFNLAQNPNGYLIFKDNMDILDNNEDIRRAFIKNCPCIDFLKNIIKLEPHDTFTSLTDDVAWLCQNKYAQNLINECFDYYLFNNKRDSNHENFDVIREGNTRLKLYFLLMNRNPIFISEFEKYITEDGIKNYKKAKLFLDVCGSEIYKLYEIPNTEEYQKLVFKNQYEGLETNLKYKKEKHDPIIDYYRLESFMYTKNIQHIKNGINYILFGNGLIHKYKQNMKDICESITTNPLSYPIIDIYLKKNLFEQQHIDNLFYALSSQENLYRIPPYTNFTAIKLLEKYEKYINWSELSKNKLAMHLLEQNQDKIDWSNISSNPNIFCK